MLANIFEGYDKAAPPLLHSNDTVNGTLQVVVYGTVEVDPFSSSVSLRVSLRQWWNDPRLAWDSNTTFSGIKEIRLRSWQEKHSPWLLDTCLREGKGSPFIEELQEQDIILFANGSIYWARFGILKVQHEFNMLRYPNDQQNITLRFVSWLHSNDKINLKYKFDDERRTLVSKYPECIPWCVSTNGWEVSGVESVNTTWDSHVT